MQHSLTQKLYGALIDPVVWRVENFFDSLGLSFFLKDQYHHTRMKIRNPVKEQIAFLQLFQEWYEDGANMLVACSHIESSARRKGRKNTFAERAAKSVGVSLRNGGTVAQGMTGLFDKEIIDLFAVGEANDTLSEMLEDYLTKRESDSELVGLFIKSFSYPGAILAGLLVGFVLIAVVGVPYISKMVSIQQLPADAKQLVELSQYTADNVGMYINVLSIFWMAFAWAKANFVGKYRPLLDKYVFLFQIYKTMVSNSTIKKIAMLSQSGISLHNTVVILLRHSTPYERHFLTKVKQRLSSSTGSVADYLDVGLLDDDVFARLAGLAHLEGEAAKYNAIRTAGVRSGEISKKSILSSIRLATWIIWCAVMMLAFYFVLGVIDFTLNIDKFITV